MIKARLVPVSGQASLLKIREVVNNIDGLISYLARKFAEEVKKVLQALGMGGLASSIESTLGGILGDADALAFVESGRKESVAPGKKFLKIILKSGQVYWRKRAGAVQARPVLDDATEKIFNESDPLDLSERV
jgi:hypothetical protein